MTTYEYGQGTSDGHLPGGRRLVRSVTVHDARFTDDDILGALERAEDVALVCGGCGHPRDEVWPVDAEHARQLDKELYAEEVTCMACGKKETAIQRLDNPAPGTKVVVRRRD